MLYASDSDEDSDSTDAALGCFCCLFLLISLALAIGYLQSKKKKRYRFIPMYQTPGLPRARIPGYNRAPYHDYTKPWDYTRDYTPDSEDVSVDTVASYHGSPTKVFQEVHVHQYHAPLYDMSHKLEQNITDSVYLDKSSRAETGFYCTHCRELLRHNWKMCPKCLTLVYDFSHEEGEKEGDWEEEEETWEEAEIEE